MKDLRIKYNELESELARIFSNYIVGYEEIILLDKSELETDDGLGAEDYFERRNYANGKVIEVFILKVSTDGIYTVDSQDNNTKSVIKFSDLASVEDRLNLLGLIENKLKIK